MAEVYWISFLVSSLCIGLFIKQFTVIKRMIVLLSFSGALAYFIMTMPKLFETDTLILLTIIFGISASGVVLAFSMIHYIASKENVGLAISLNNVFIVLGGMTGQIMFGKVVDNWNILRKYDLSNLSPTIDGYYGSGVFMLLCSSMLALFFIVTAIRKHKQN